MDNQKNYARIERAAARRRGVSQAAIYLLLTLWALIVLFPFYWMILTSVKSYSQYNAERKPAFFTLSPTLQNYVDAFAGKDFLLWFANSLILSLGAVALTMIVGLFAGYAFAKMKFRGRDALFSLIIPLMSVPPVAMLIPLFRTVVKLGMVNTLGSVIFIYCGLCLPMTVYMIRNFLLSVPDAILEAARIDGCSRFRSLFSIVLPLSVPAIITSGLVNLVWAWNELMVALVFLQKEHLRTLIVGTTIFKSRYSLNVPVIMAGLVVVTLPMIIVYIFGQKKLVQGLMSGAVKE